MAQLNAQNRPLSLRNGLMHITLLLGMGFVHQNYDLRKRIELGWEIGLVLLGYPWEFLVGVDHAWFYES